MRPRIAINGRFLSQPTVGVQRFASEVVKAIDALIASGDYAALDGRVTIFAPRAARDIPLRHIRIHRFGLTGGYFWEQVEFPLRAAGRLLLNLCTVGPVAVRNQVVVVHDATVRAQPQNFTARFRAVYNFIVPRLLRRSRCAVTVSEFSRREIGKWFGVDTSRMPVCFEGSDHVAVVTPDYAILDRLGLRGRKFFLCVGAANNKNIETVLAAFAQSGLDDVQIVVTGYRQKRVNGEQSETARHGICDAGYVSDQELRALYEHALALVTPSRYEGFGLTPVEAMSCGCPVIISNQPAMLEICGDAALQCQADDSGELARLMRIVHDDPARRNALIAAGKARAAQFSWSATARVLLDVCMRAMEAENVAQRRAAVPQTGESF
jgi:glycosyltransferase involved in cell wall biosynthesis